MALESLAADVLIGPQHARLGENTLVTVVSAAGAWYSTVLPLAMLCTDPSACPQKISAPGKTGGPSATGPCISGRLISATSAGAWVAHSAVMGPLAVTAVLTVPPLAGTPRTVAPSM